MSMLKHLRPLPDTGRWRNWRALIATCAPFYDRQVHSVSFSMLALTTSAYGGATCLNGAGHRVQRMARREKPAMTER